MLPVNIGNGFIVKAVSSSELSTILNEHFKKTFSNRSDSSSRPLVADSAQEKILSREKDFNRYRLRLAIYSNENVVGWHYGYATDPETYYMQNSAILEPFRNQGLYSKLLDVVMTQLENERFQVITSTHHPNNAPVLIPKLKKGFVISSMQLHERFNFLVELKYFTNEQRRHEFSKKIGLTI